MKLGVFNKDSIIDKQAFIIYCNAKQEVKKYHLVNTSISAEHFQAVSIADRKSKTFRQDRVLKIFSDESELDEFDLNSINLSDYSLNFAPVRSRIRKMDKLSICFTGFGASDKQALTEIAIDNNLHVTSGVTKSLSFLCCGPNKGPSKITKAQENGAIILTQGQFENLIDTGEIPESGEYELLGYDELPVKKTLAETIDDTFSVLRTLQRRQTLLANFVNGYALGWRFKVHQCHRPALDIKLNDITCEKQTKKVWTQGHHFNFLGGEFIQSEKVEGQPDISLQIKFTTPAGFDTVDTLEGKFTGVFRKNNASTAKGEKKAEQMDVLFNSQSYDEGSVTVDVFSVDGNKHTKIDRVEMSQVDFVTLLQLGEVTFVEKKATGKKLVTYNPFKTVKGIN